MSWITTGVGVYLGVSFCVGAILGPLLRSKISSETVEHPEFFEQTSWRDDPSV